MGLPESRAGAFFDIVQTQIILSLRGLSFKPRAAKDVPPALARRADVAFTVAQCLSPIDLLRGAAMVGRSLREALRTRDPVRIARALAVSAVVQSTRGAVGRRRAERLIDRGRTLTDGRETPEAAAYLRLCEAISHFQGGAWARCLKAAEDAAQAFRRDKPGLVWETTTADAYALGSALWMGDLLRVRDVAPERAQDARARGDRYSEAYFVLAVFAVPSMLRDVPAAGLAEVERAHESWRRKSVDFQDFYYWLSRIYLALYQGEGAEALRLANETLRSFRWSFVWQVEITRALLIDARGRAAVAAGELALARTEAARMRRLGLDWHRALGDLIEGAAAFRAGKRDQARDLLRRGAEGAERSDMLIYAQAGRFAHGRCVGGSWGDDEARGALAWVTARGAVNAERFLRLICPIPGA